MFDERAATTDPLGAGYPHPTPQSTPSIEVPPCSTRQALDAALLVLVVPAVLILRGVFAALLQLPLISRPVWFSTARHVFWGSGPHHPIFHSQPFTPAFLGCLNLGNDGRLERPHERHRLQRQHVIISLHTGPSPTLSRKKVVSPLLFM